MRTYSYTITRTSRGDASQGPEWLTMTTRGPQATQEQAHGQQDMAKRGEKAAATDVQITVADAQVGLSTPGDRV